MAESDRRRSLENILHNFVADSVDEIRGKEAFMKRLSTFSITKWNGKPQDISPLECARLGWSNVDIDLLKCTSCSEILAAKLPKRFQLDLYKQASDKLRCQIREKHHQMCPWRHNPCPESYVDIGSWKKEEIEKDFISRLDSLIPLSDVIPSLEDEHEIEISQNLDKLKQIVDFNFDLPIAQLALRGWKSNCKLTEPNLTLKCEFCVRVVGLWMFVSKNDEENRPIKKIKLEANSKDEKKKFNPIEEHNIWCPWVAKSTQSQIEGWKLVLEVLCHQGKTRSPGNKLPKLSEVRKWLDV